MPRTTAPKSPPPPTNVPLDAGGQRLLDAVLADPLDVEPRLVFSDWLLERGDPRGEFIQLQCALGRPLVGARAQAWQRPTMEGDPTALQKRERALLKTYEKQWLLPIRPSIRTWRWARGFVDRVVADTTAFLQGANTIFATTPLLDLQLTALKRPQLHALAAQATTARLRALDVSFQRLDEAALAAFDADHWRGLRYLNLAGNRFGVAGARALGQARGLGGLERLVINDASLTDECVEALVQAPFFSRLTELELGWNAEVSGRACVLAARAGRALKTLRLRSTGLTPSDFPALAAAAPASLEYLKVSAGDGALARAHFPPGVAVVE